MNIVTTISLSSQMCPRPVSDSDEGIESIWEQQYSLAEIVDPSQFKSYDELKTKLDTVLKGAAVSVSSQTDDLEDDKLCSDCYTKK